MEIGYFSNFKKANKNEKENIHVSACQFCNAQHPSSDYG